MNDRSVPAGGPRERTLRRIVQAVPVLHIRGTRGHDRWLYGPISLGF